MYGLPEDFDATVFLGHELVMVSFTTNTVNLVFDGDVAITIEASFRHHSPTGEASTEVPPVRSSTLMTLLGHRVVAARSSRDGTLTLQFDGAGSIDCLDDSKAFESYHLRFADREVVV